MGSSTSSMPVFQVVTLWDVGSDPAVRDAWSSLLALLLEADALWYALQFGPACWGCGGIQVTKHPKGPCGPKGSCFQSCICKSGLFYLLGLQSLWAIWESQRANYCLDICILGDLECAAGDHMLLSAGAVPFLGVVKRHLSAEVIHHPVHSELEQQREHGCD